jgi:hypothetical protein
MKKTQVYFARIAGLLTVCVVVLCFSARAQEQKTVTGELLDMKCYKASNEHGEGHKSCAAKCINGGAPMGVLTSDGKVYLLIEDEAKKEPYEEAKKHAGEQVTVTGALSEKDGTEGLIVSEVKGT